MHLYPGTNPVSYATGFFPRHTIFVNELMPGNRKTPSLQSGLQYTVENLIVASTDTSSGHTQGFLVGAKSPFILGVLFIRKLRWR